MPVRERADQTVEGRWDARSRNAMEISDNGSCSSKLFLNPHLAEVLDHGYVISITASPHDLFLETCPIKARCISLLFSFLLCANPSHRLGLVES